MEPTLIILFIILFLLSAFFSGTELALMSLASHKIEAIYKEWKYWADSLKKIKENNDRLLITILIWNNLVNVYTAALATTIAISLATKSGLEQSVAVGIATWLVTFLLLLFWEIIPKSLATKNATKISLIVAPIYKILILLLYPVIIIIETIISVFSKKQFSEKITWKEIESFIDMWKHSWTLESAEHEKIKNILEFWDITVEEIMTPRVNIEAIDSKKTVGEAKKFYLEHTHSRIPVYNRTIDKIDYFFTIRDLLEFDDNKKLSDLELKETIKIPINQPIDKLFETFQKVHKHIAIIIDEYWWVAWLVTLEDIIEEVFWEIRDETDKEIDKIRKLWVNKFVIESDVLIKDILDKFSLELKDIWLNEDEFYWETVSFILTDKIERFPNVLEIIKFEVEKNKDEDNENLEFKILDISDSKIGKIEVTLS